jgi:tripartite-type tricarboxylate transporter receptor subunit TctC
MIGLRRTIVLSGLLVVCLPAAAQNYPTHPIKLVSPNPVGGTNDTVVRIVSAKMSTLLNTPIVIENRGGAGGKIGAEAQPSSAGHPRRQLRSDAADQRRRSNP